jgi:hypothetical protein
VIRSLHEALAAWGVPDLPLWTVVPLVAWGLAIASCIGGVVELVLVQSLRPAVFRIGRVVLQEPYSVPRNAGSFDTGRVYTTPRGKFRIVSDREIVFSERLWKPVRFWYTPFPIKGRVTWSEGTPDVGTLEGRIPLASTLFFASLLTFVTAISVAGAVWAPTLPARFAFLAVAPICWGLAAGMYLVSLRIELPRIRAVAQEMRQQLSRVDQRSRA